MADAGVGSRRHCEELIVHGAVKVNGEVIDALPAWVDPARDRIQVDGQPIGRPEGRQIYVMLYKPKGTVTTNADPEGRRCAIDLVQHPSKARLFPVGRLDIASSGLLLLTTDGELANRLTHPRYEIPKIYEVTVGGAVPQADIERLEQAVRKPSRGAPSARGERSHLSIEKRDRTRTQMLMQLGEGRNREIRRLLLSIGHPVKKLRQIQMGSLRLRGLAIGEWRDLTAREVSELRAEAFRTPEERVERAARRARSPLKEGVRRAGQSSASEGRGAGRGPGHGPRRGSGRPSPFGPRGSEQARRGAGGAKRRASRGSR